MNPTNAQTEPVTLRTRVAALLATVFSLLSFLFTTYITYQNSQLKPKVEEIRTEVSQIKTQLEAANTGVTRLQALDDARKAELYRRLTDGNTNRQQILNSLRATFPEDRFWIERIDADNRLIETNR